LKIIHKLDVVATRKPPRPHSGWLATHDPFAIDRRLLKGTIADLAQSRDAVIAARDLLFSGL